MNDGENNELKKLWGMMNSPGWDNRRLARLMFTHCSWDTNEYDMVYFILLYTNITAIESLEFSKNVVDINPGFFNNAESFKESTLGSIKERWENGDLKNKQLGTVREIKRITGWGLKASKDYFDENIKNEIKL